MRSRPRYASAPAAQVQARQRCFTAPAARVREVLAHDHEPRALENAALTAKAVGVGVLVAGESVDLCEAPEKPVIAAPIDTMPSRRWEPYDEPFPLPQKLFDAGVMFHISCSGYQQERDRPCEVAPASHGLPANDAFKAVALDQARSLRLTDKAGSLEEGKGTVLTVTTGTPRDHE